MKGSVRGQEDQAFSKAFAMGSGDKHLWRHLWRTAIPHLKGLHRTAVQQTPSLLEERMGLSLGCDLLDAIPFKCNSRYLYTDVLAQDQDMQGHSTYLSSCTPLFHQVGEKLGFIPLPGTATALQLVVIFQSAD